jgi:hypothetical protein
MAHGQWTEVEARSVLDGLKRSGLSIEKFARSRGLTPQRLYWWKKKLCIRADRSTGATPALLPVRVTESHPEARRGEPVTVLLRSGHILKVGRDFDETAFARVVELLERS